VTVVRLGIRTQALGWVLAAVGVFLLTADMVLLGLNAARVDTGRVALNAILGVAILAYTGAGRLITSRRPGNAVGWLLGLIGITIATSWPAWALRILTRPVNAAGTRLYSSLPPSGNNRG